MAIRDRILAARGREAPDLVLKHARVVNVLTNEILPADVAIHEGYVVGVGEYRARTRSTWQAALLPGLIDGHLHIESTMLAPGEFARAVVPHGVTSVVVDPHEIGNVLGADGVRHAHPRHRRPAASLLRQRALVRARLADGERGLHAGRRGDRRRCSTRRAWSASPR